MTVKGVGVALAVVWQLLNVSAYTSHETGSTTTASGAPAVAGVTVAADHLPFGTRLYIPTLERWFTVADRFGGGYNDRLDVYMDDPADAWAFGRQWLSVMIVTEGADQ